MNSRNPLSEEAKTADSASPTLAETHPQPFSFFILSAWCGVVSGLLEVGTIVIHKHTFDTNHLYGMSRHFLWLIPAANLCLFLSLSVVSWLATLVWPRWASWLAPRGLCTLTILPPFLVACPQVYGLAWLVVALGISVQLVPILKRHLEGFRRLVRTTLPVAAAVVPILAGSLWLPERIQAWREEARALPPSSSPNLLLIVLDTVAADHLSLHGYDRPTSPTLDELAPRGIRFNSVRAASSWTLPSHAIMFTGRWSHELSANWLTPLDGAYPTLAEFLGSRGYATAGFVANNLYCAADSGLGRGFTIYRDYIFPRLSAFRMSSLVDRPVAGFRALGEFLADRLDLDLLMPTVQRLWWQLNSDRKAAAAIHRELIDWLSNRRQPERPFFAFLNFYDAHYPYQLPETSMHRFGFGPRTSRESQIIQNWWQLDKRGLSEQEIAFVRDSYDDCIADLDEQLGRLIDELRRRGLLDRTWVIIAADHGESFGEHAGVFCHGTSLYRTELHVPLVILPPAANPSPAGRAVDETVSLRDLAATVVDLAGLSAGSPFPGESLARFWSGSSPAPHEPSPSDRALPRSSPTILC